MRRWLWVLALVLALGENVSSQDGRAFRVEFRQVSPHAWVHTSWALYNGAPTASNGLIWVGARSVILVDTAWDQAQTLQVLDFIDRSFHKPVAVAFITHSHEDRSAGIPLIEARAIKLCMNVRTRELLSLDPASPGLILQQDGPMAVDGTALDVRYPGAAHAPDNITLWFPEDRLLYGGCIFKAADATGIGNVQDADLGSWRRVIAWLRSGYPSARVVIPGHGAGGGSELLTHTADLLGAAR